MINRFTESFDNWEIGTMRRKKQTNKQTNNKGVWERLRWNEFEMNNRKNLCN